MKLPIATLLFPALVLATPRPEEYRHPKPSHKSSSSLTSTRSSLPSSSSEIIFSSTAQFPTTSTSVAVPIETPATTTVPPTIVSTPSPVACTSSSALPTIYLAGDSKTAAKGGGNGTEGWGEYLRYSFPSGMTILNWATAGRSARSYTREGRFQKIIDVVKPGDWVVIEFGTNDGGSPYPAEKDNGRADCPGFGNETCPTVYQNKTEIVQTYVTYITNATSIFLSKGAKVIIASPTPNNPWEFGTYAYSPSIYTNYSSLSATLLGGPAAGVYFVPHSQYAAQAMLNIGSTAAIAPYYPLDHGHTAPYLAGLLAQSFVLGLKCGSAPLAAYSMNSTSRIMGVEGGLIGGCMSVVEGVNGTLPI